MRRTVGETFLRKRFLLVCSLFLLGALLCPEGVLARDEARQPGARNAPSGARDKAAEKRNKPSGARGSAAKAPGARESVVSLLLKSAGRPAGRQAEEGFALRVPDAANDGEAFLLEFGAPGARSVRIEWRDQQLNLGPCEGGPGGEGLCRALLPVPLDEEARSLPLELNIVWADGKKERLSASVPVTKRRYPVQKLKVDPKYVTPPPEMAERIKRERAELRAAVSVVSPKRYWNLPLSRPVPGEVTSEYGLRRVFNGERKGAHRGVDFDGNTGDPIISLENGEVALVAEHYYSGKIVVIDHGVGVFSAYLHLSDVNVVQGQKVLRGDMIGLIGSTGRVTGPHLHLSLYVLGLSVNAAACISM